MTAYVQAAVGPFAVAAREPRVLSRQSKARTAASRPGTLAEHCPARPSAESGLWLYRDRTLALLRRYLRLSLQVGRLPSLLGREVLRVRAHVSGYEAATFEDTVIFVHDIERCLEELPQFAKALIGLIVLEEYTQLETAQILGCGLRTVVRNYPEALDRVSEMFLERGILSPLPGGG